jgi:quercetin dioxygenase-like cupin family protein
MTIGGYRRNVLYRGNGMEIVEIIWPAGARTPKHDHGSSGVCWVLQGSVVEVREGKKTRATKGAQMFEIPFETVHIVGNEEPEEAITLHVYTPELTMTTYPDDETDAALCA